MSISLLILFTMLGLNLAIAGAVAWFLWKRGGGDSNQQRATLKSLMNEAVGELGQKLTEQSQTVLQGERAVIATDLSNKQKQIEQTVQELRTELRARQQDLQRLEKDRQQQFTEVSTRIKEHQQITQELTASTAKLKSLLDNNQERGQWGEFILDDILRTAGLVEGVHYQRQMPLGTSAVKPDITLLLPDHRVVAVDVKFPYAALQKMVEATTTAAKATHRKEFIQDVKKKLGDIAKRGYISPEQGTLDYAILFVPNETLFSFINQTTPEIIEQAMQAHIMIVSPFTFLIVARTIMESYRNFLMENHLREVVQHITVFVDEWGKFSEEFLRFGEQIDRLDDQYQKLSTTRYRQMERRMGAIDLLQTGQGKTPLPIAPDAPPPIMEQE
jgi:DNA recombination protein RmuC